MASGGSFNFTWFNCMHVLDKPIKMTVSYSDGSVFNEEVTPFIIRRRFPFRMRTGKLLRPEKIVLDVPETIEDEVKDYLGEYLPWIMHPFKNEGTTINSTHYILAKSEVLKTELAKTL